MRYETVVEISPCGRPMLRLVIVPDEPVPPVTDEDGTTIISYDDEDPYTIKENVVTWET